MGIFLMRPNLEGLLEGLKFEKQQEYGKSCASCCCVFAMMDMHSYSEKDLYICSLCKYQPKILEVNSVYFHDVLSSSCI